MTIPARCETLREDDSNDSIRVFGRVSSVCVMLVAALAMIGGLSQRALMSFYGARFLRCRRARRLITDDKDTLLAKFMLLMPIWY